MLAKKQAMDEVKQHSAGKMMANVGAVSARIGGQVRATD